MAIYRPWDIDAGKTAGGYSSVPTNTTNVSNTNINTSTTSPASSPWANLTVPTYPTTGASLPGYVLAEFNQRRRGLDSDLARALATSSRGQGRLRVGAGLSRDEARRGFQRSSEDMLRTMAGRGVARSGMFAGRGVRRLTEDLTSRYGQIDFQLQNDIAALMDLVRDAEARRNQGYGDISSEEAIIRSDPKRYMVGA